MFGYVIPDKPNMYMKDYYEFRAYYCGLCKSIGKSQGQMMRFSLSYDMTFLSLFLHGVRGITPEIKFERCVCHPVTKRQITAKDDVSLAVADISTLLFYYKCEDDVRDGKPLRACVQKVIKGKKKRATGRFADSEKAIREGYERLNKCEKEKSRNLDECASVFGSMLNDALKPLFADKASEFTDRFCVLLGKWIYYIDALDDYDKDKNSGNYNPFVTVFGCESKAKLMDENSGRINDMFKALVNEMQEVYDKIPIITAEGVITNTVYYGIPYMTGKVMRCEKCKKIRL